MRSTVSGGVLTLLLLRESCEAQFGEERSSLQQAHSAGCALATGPDLDVDDDRMGAYYAGSGYGFCLMPRSSQLPSNPVVASHSGLWVSGSPGN